MRLGDIGRRWEVRCTAIGARVRAGDHSGGNLTPDTTVFTLAFSTYFGVERAVEHE